MTEDRHVVEVVKDLKTVGETKLTKEIVKGNFSPLFRSLAGNIDDLEKKKFLSFDAKTKRGTYYINCTTEEDGDRKTTFKEHTINMPTVYKYAQQFVTSITEVLQRSYNRSTNELKKLGAVCLSFASHLQCISGRMEKKGLVDAMKIVIAHCLAEDPELRTPGIKVTFAEEIIDSM